MAKGAHSAAPAKKEKKTEPLRIKIQRPEKSERMKREKTVQQTSSEEIREKASRKAERLESVRAGSYKLLVVLTVIAAVVALGFVALYIVGKNVTQSDVNLPNVYVDGIHVGSLTKEETKELLVSEGWVEANTGKLKVTIPRDVSFEIDYVESGAVLTLDRAVDEAYSYGHDGSILNNVKTWVGGLMKAKDVGAVEKKLNDELISSAVSAAVADFNRANSSAVAYELDRDSAVVRMDKGAGNLKLDADELSGLVRDALLEKKNELVYSPALSVPEPDFKAILDELSAEPVNARYDKESDSIIPEVSGASFDVTQAKKLWDSAPMFSVIEIPATLSLPEVTSDTLEELLFRDVLGEKATTLSGSSKNRINNINLVAQKLDGLVLEPGEEFSYNGYIGERTEEAGFLGAPAYDNGKVIWEIGGGICQGSSTLYYCCLCAELEILDRTEHDFVVAYLPAGLDATVSFPRPDFKFRNTLDYPIKIKAWVDYDANTLNIQILGTNLTGLRVEPVSGRWPLYDEVYTDVQTGWGAASYKLYYDAEGNQVGEKVYICNSVYHLHEEDIKWPPEYYEQATDSGEEAENGGTDVVVQDTGGEPEGTTDGNA